MELAESACLRLFVSVTAAYIAYLYRQCAVYKSVLNTAADNAGGKLRSKRYRASTLIVKGIHFLLNNIRCIPDAALKHLGMLKNRDSYFIKAVKPGSIEHSPLNKLPAAAFCGQYIVSAFYGAIYFSHYCIAPRFYEFLTISRQSRSPRSSP